MGKKHRWGKGGKNLLKRVKKAVDKAADDVTAAVQQHVATEEPKGVETPAVAAPAVATETIKVTLPNGTSFEGAPDQVRQMMAMFSTMTTSAPTTTTVAAAAPDTDVAGGAGGSAGAMATASDSAVVAPVHSDEPMKPLGDAEDPPMES